MKTRIILLILLMLIASVTVAQTDDDQTDDIIRDYYSLCRGGTDAEIFSWHGINQDGLPPVDLDRRANDFICDEKAVYTPHEGIVWGVTGRYGGVVLIDDPQHEVCMVFLGMETIELEAEQEVTAGEFVGLYRWHIHFAALDAPCEAVNWYDFDARDLELPIAWIELGEVIPADIHEHDALPLVSQNPAGE